ncbi:hypothetical protein mRhiFer1_009559 [Rhinolophus ferrumequinum]|uniref:BRCT domain-containing protein n=1 Tax=Rhinolophus ferrumequinum TaxID=59479 RepID=A0A7J7ZR84_RHIFE|nr:hypothetical protein mRhiFer1_009559 [Rhinolophus ferrumequinum]
MKEEDEGASSLRPGALFFSRINKISAATVSDLAGPSCAAATLQASSATCSASPSSRAVGSTSKPHEFPKGKRKLDLNQEERKTLSKQSSQPSPSALKKPKLPAPTRTPATASVVAPAHGAVPGKPRGECTEPRGPRAGPQELGKILEYVVVLPESFPLRAPGQGPTAGGQVSAGLDSRSTHLICVFANTPKFSQVLGLGGHIVRKEWVLDCHRMHRRLPPQRFLMAGPGSSKDEGDPHSSSSGVKRPSFPERAPRSKPSPLRQQDPTYPRDPQPQKRPNPEFPGDERRKLSRYVTAFNGELEDYTSDQVQFVMTAQEWDPSFEEALVDNPSLVFVRPRWIYSCNEKQKLVPHQLYGVVAQA